MHVEIKICYNVTIKISLCVSIPSDPWETWGGRGGGAEPLCSEADVEDPWLPGNCVVTKEAGGRVRDTSKLEQSPWLHLDVRMDYSHWNGEKLSITVTDFHNPRSLIWWTLHKFTWLIRHRHCRESKHGHSRRKRKKSSGPLPSLFCLVPSFYMRLIIFFQRSLQDLHQVFL